MRRSPEAGAAGSEYVAEEAGVVEVGILRAAAVLSPALEVAAAASTSWT